MKTLSLLLAGLATLLPFTPAPACPIVTSYRTSYATPIYETPVIVTPAIVTQFVAIPTYSAAYLGPVPALAAPVAPQAAPVAAQPSVCESRLAAVLDRLEALERRQGPQTVPASGSGAAQNGAPEPLGPPSAVQTPPSDRAAPPPAPAPNPSAGLAVFTGRCAACHDANKLKDKQPAFRKDGQLLALDCLTALDCTAALAKGTMPPAGKQLSEQEALDLVEWLKQQAHTQGKKP
jgi:mono/diheme cytochrome c family protein